MKHHYKVAPFIAAVGNTQGSPEAAAQLEALIATWAELDWKYVRLERVDTFIAGTSGCFGLGAEPGRVVSFSMAVFEHEGDTASSN